MARKAPAYRLHRASGQAVVTLTDAVTGKRRDIYLGDHGSPESRELYHHHLARWERNGRRVDVVADLPTEEAATVTVLVRAYWRHAKSYYGEGNKTLLDQGATLRMLRAVHGSLAVDRFGPKLLQELRLTMVARGWSRSTVNRRVRYIVAMYRWGVAQEMVQPASAQALAAVSGLRRGEHGVREGKAVKPVPEHLIGPTKQHLSTHFRIMVDLQLLTGARAGELLTMRREQIDRSGKVWLFKPTEHKTAHHGHDRIIAIGPRAQKLLTPLLGHRLDGYVFAPTEAEGRHGAHASREHYDVATFRRAIQRACDDAFPPPAELARQRVPNPDSRKKTRLESVAEWRKRLGTKKWQELQQWRKDHRWHPHRLRHNAATTLRREFGIEAAKLLLGHRSAGITEIYAEADATKAAIIAGKVG